MHHFPAEQWIDFARETGDPECRLRIERHLDTGCTDCLEAMQFWRNVTQAAYREEGYQPAEDAVGGVKAAFVRMARHRPAAAAATRARLIFDSYRQPLMAGVRDAALSPRQLLHRAGPYLIDLRLERRAGAEQCVVTGQVLDSEHPEAGAGGVEIVVLQGKRLVGEAVTNAFGEFRVDLDEDHAAQLLLEFPGRTAIRIVLPAGRRSRS